MAQYSINSLEGKLLLAATVLASGMAFLDGTVVNIAIPVIQKTFHASLTQIEWMVNGYMLMLASLILVSGALGDLYGRKKIFSYGLVFFTFASLLCSLSQTMDQLIAFRVLQGIAAAMMIPGSLSIINSSFAEHDRGKAIGLWSGFAGGVAALGPFLGGFLVQTFGWPSIFYINIPLGLLAIYLTSKYVTEAKNEHAKRLDLYGALFIFLGLLGISFGLIEAPSRGWGEPSVWGSLIVGAIMLVAFIFREKTVKEPLMPLQIFHSKLVSGANLITLFLYFSLNAVIFFLVLNLQQLQHFSPLLAGMSMLPSILIITFFSGRGGELSDKTGPRLPMIVGPLIVSAGMGLMALSGKNINYFTSFMPALILVGLGMCLVIGPLTKSALSVEQRYSGAASGVNNAIARIAGLLAIALLGAIILTSFSSHLSSELDKSHLTMSEKQQISEQKNKLGAIDIPATFSSESRREAQEIIENSFLAGFRVIMTFAAFLAFLSSIIAFLTIQNPSKHKSSGS